MIYNCQAPTSTYSGYHYANEVFLRDTMAQLKIFPEELSITTIPSAFAAAVFAASHHPEPFSTWAAVQAAVQAAVLAGIITY